ncbi:MAG: M67 family metallopeptidase [Chloroflexota bacterium]|nr:M67 family metallopeptidase [Chloroflexota bacterium]
MNPLWLTPAHADQIVAHAQTEVPREACGLIIGTPDFHAVEIVPIPNAAADPDHSYRMDERVLAAALTDADARGCSLIGIYHSHPNGDPLPSPDDIALAFYPDTAYVIVGMKPPQPRLAAWHIRYGQVEPISLHIDRTPPNLRAEQTTAQKVAIVVAALLAFSALILLSLSLLPPAPMIPR